MKCPQCNEFETDDVGLVECPKCHDVFDTREECDDESYTPLSWRDVLDFGDYDDEVFICEFCHGTGQDWDLTPCGECDGEGYQYWL